MSLALLKLNGCMYGFMSVCGRPERQGDQWDCICSQPIVEGRWHLTGGIQQNVFHVFIFAGSKHGQTFVPLFLIYFGSKGCSERAPVQT